MDTATYDKMDIDKVISNSKKAPKRRAGKLQGMTSKPRQLQLPTSKHTWNSPSAMSESNPPDRVQARQWR